jgi:FkbM family methyltransferase
LSADLGNDAWRRAAEERRRELRLRAAGARRCIVFGACDYGRHVKAATESVGLVVEAFVDNDLAKQGLPFAGVQVLSPSEAAGDPRMARLWVIGIYTSSGPRRQCDELGVTALTFPELTWAFDGLLPYYALDGPERFFEASAEMQRAADLWHDESSRAEYRSQAGWRMTLDYDLLGSPSPRDEEYYPPDVLAPSAHEVFVDCGAYQGDTVEWFHEKNGGRFSKIIAIEPDPKNAAIMRAKLPDWRREMPGTVTIEEVAVGASPGFTEFDGTGTVRSRVGEGGQRVEVRTLDQLLDGERPTFVKMDVEGAEADVLRGGAQVIARHAPVLAVCLYHRPADLWEIPLLIRSLCDDYRLFLRRYSDECWETVCYAVPPGRTLS